MHNHRILDLFDIQAEALLWIYKEITESPGGRPQNKSATSHYHIKAAASAVLFKSLLNEAQ